MLISAIILRKSNKTLFTENITAMLLSTEILLQTFSLLIYSWKSFWFKNKYLSKTYTQNYTIIE